MSINLSSISLGLDLATALSLAVTVAITYSAYKRNLGKQRKASIGEERKHERVIKLSQTQEYYDKLLGEFILAGSNGDLEIALKKMTEIYHYCHYDLRRHFAIYATKANLDLLDLIIKDLLRSKDEYEQKGRFDAVKLTNNLIKLDINILLQLRELMHDESTETSKKIINQFAKERFGYTEIQKD